MNYALEEGNLLNVMPMDICRTKIVSIFCIVGNYRERKLSRIGGK